jgi:dephospho-CoA kinase
MRPLTIGLTGGIASGKSLVSSAFEALGVPVMDADFAARAIVEPGTPALKAIVQRFGAAILQADGSLDRRALRARVFSDGSQRRQLEAITHPAIRQYLRDWRDAQITPYCVLAIALLVEGSSRALVDRVLVVDVPESVQLARLIQRDGVEETLARRMIAAQASRAQRLAAADDVIVNDGSPESARLEVAKLHQQYLELAKNFSAKLG